MLVEILAHTYLNPVVRLDDGSYELEAIDLHPHLHPRGGYAHVARLALLLPQLVRVGNERWPLLFLEETVWTVEPARVDRDPNLEAWQNVNRP